MTDRYINIFTDFGFKKVFGEEVNKELLPQEREAYKDSLKYYRDLKNSLDTAREEGEIEGMIKGKIEGKIEVAKTLMNMGEQDERIAKISGLSLEEIRKLRTGM